MLHSGRVTRIIEKGERLISEARASEKARTSSLTFCISILAAAAAINEIMKATAEWLAAEETALPSWASCDGYCGRVFEKVAANEEIARGN